MVRAPTSEDQGAETRDQGGERRRGSGQKGKDARLSCCAAFAFGIVLARGGDTAAGSTAEAFAPLCTVFLETGVAVESAKKMTEAARQRVAEVEAQLNATLAAKRRDIKRAGC
ncbi:hypothetical protein ERJ75_000806300 [Trypanosoma vivax]|nr:hypothetical protein ERJ75_000806300 [Trypanosoma vivax]